MIFKLLHSVASLIGRCRAVVCLRLALLAGAFLIVGCASYPGDNFLRLTESKLALDDSGTISKAQSLTVDLLDHFDIAADRRTTFETISLERVIRKDRYTKLSHIYDTLVLASGDIDIVFAKNSVIVANGVTHISHSSNNVVVVANNLDIAHDGSNENGSILIAKGRIKVSHARNSIVSSLRGVKMTGANGVVAYNTPNQKVSWGQISDLAAKPLFAEEKQPTGYDPALSLKADTEDKSAHRITENKFRTPKWKEAKVHMVCLYESHSRKVIVEVLKTEKPVILVVCAHEDIIWDVRASDGAEIVQVIASGSYRQRVEGTTAPVATYSSEGSRLYFYTYSKKMPTDPKLIEKVFQLTGKEIFSYQGRYGYDNTPFIVGARGIRGNECQATVFEIAGLSIRIDCADLKTRPPRLPNVDGSAYAKDKEIQDHISAVNRHPARPGTRLTVVFGKPDHLVKRFNEKFPACSLLLDTFISRYGKAEHIYRDREGGNNDWYYVWQQDNASLKLACIGFESKRYARYAQIVLTPK